MRKRRKDWRGLYISFNFAYLGEHLISGANCETSSDTMNTVFPYLCIQSERVALHSWSRLLARSTSSACALFLASSLCTCAACSPLLWARERRSSMESPFDASTSSVFLDFCSFNSSERFFVVAGGDRRGSCGTEYLPCVTCHSIMRRRRMVINDDNRGSVPTS